MSALMLIYMVVLLQETLSTLSEVKGQKCYTRLRSSIEERAGSVMFSRSMRHLTCHPSLESCPFFRRWGPTLSDSFVHLCAGLGTGKTHYFFFPCLQIFIILHFNNKTSCTIIPDTGECFCFYSKSLWLSLSLFAEEFYKLIPRQIKIKTLRSFGDSHKGSLEIGCKNWHHFSKRVQEFPLNAWRCPWRPASGHVAFLKTSLTLRLRADIFPDSVGRHRTEMYEWLVVISFEGVKIKLHIENRRNAICNVKDDPSSTPRSVCRPLPVFSKHLYP